MKYIITAESGSDLTGEQALKHGIEVVPMHVTMGGKSYDDGTFPSRKICDYYAGHGEVPKTSASTEHDFQVVFDRIHARNPQAHILHMAYSASTTISYNCARMAAIGREYVTIMDTEQVSVGQGVAVQLTADYLEQHPDLLPAEALLAAEQICQRIKMCFIPQDLHYLQAGGRCSSVEGFAGRLLNLHPCIEVRDGELVATKKYRGSFKKVIPELCTEFLSGGNLKKDRLWLIGSVGLDRDSQLLAERSVHALGYRNITWVETGCVITAHAGPGTFGIVGTI